MSSGLNGVRAQVLGLTGFRVPGGRTAIWGSGLRMYFFGWL